MEFPKTSYVITVDIWFKREDGTRSASRGSMDVYASSAAEALELHKELVLKESNPSYDWEDVQVLSVTPREFSELMEYGSKAARAYAAGRWDGI